MEKLVSISSKPLPVNESDNCRKCCFYGNDCTKLPEYFDNVGSGNCNESPGSFYAVMDVSL